MVMVGNVQLHSTVSTMGRRPVRRRQIIDVLRKQIIDGSLLAGSQLPSRPVLARRFSTGTSTMRQALERLEEDGFLTTQGTRGTFVAGHPPHLTRFGVVFPDHPRQRLRVWSRFYAAIDHVAAEFPARQDRKLVSYYDSDAGDKSHDYRRLADDIEHHRLAGLIFVTPPYGLGNTPVVTSPKVRRVTVSLESFRSDIPAIYPNYDHFIERALDRLAAAGRRKIAVINTAAMGPNEPKLLSGLEARGMATRPCWLLHLAAADPTGARPLAHLLMSRPDDRPDGLLILDDNLVLPITAGLLDAGVRPPADLTVVAHCNFPLLPEAVVPVEFLGFDTHQLLQTSLDLFDTMASGGTPPAMTRLPAVFAGEQSAPHVAGWN